VDTLGVFGIGLSIIIGVGICCAEGRLGRGIVLVGDCDVNVKVQASVLKCN
jgi:hypothetical protein